MGVCMGWGVGGLSCLRRLWAPGSRSQLDSAGGGGGGGAAETGSAAAIAIIDVAAVVVKGPTGPGCRSAAARFRAISRRRHDRFARVIAQRHRGGKASRWALGAGPTRRLRAGPTRRFRAGPARRLRSGAQWVGTWGCIGPRPISSPPQPHSSYPTPLIPPHPTPPPRRARDALAAGG
jgi:hypothetical protein